MEVIEQLILIDLLHIPLKFLEDSLLHLFTKNFLVTFEKEDLFYIWRWFLCGVPWTSCWPLTEIFIFTAMCVIVISSWYRCLNPSSHPSCLRTCGAWLRQLDRQQGRSLRKRGWTVCSFLAIWHSKLINLLLGTTIEPIPAVTFSQSSASSQPFCGYWNSLSPWISKLCTLIPILQPL